MRRTRKIGNALMFEPAVTRKSAYRRVLDDLLDLFGGSAQPVVAQLLESGKLPPGTGAARDGAQEKGRPQVMEHLLFSTVVLAVALAAAHFLPLTARTRYGIVFCGLAKFALPSAAGRQSPPHTG